MSKVMELFQLSAVVLQCGSDFLSGDQLDCFDSTVKGQAKCVEFVKSFNLPVLMLGGGGYTVIMSPGAGLTKQLWPWT